MDNQIPTTKLSRAKIVGKSVVKIGGVQAKGFIKKAFVSKKNKVEVKKETDEQSADILFESLGELKGLSVKVAQQVALGMPFLPDAYKDKISKSFNSIPPLNKALIRKTIKTQLQGYPDDIFDTFDTDAFAAASLGQVHHATKDGQSLAVKIQYPSIKKSMQSDMSLIRFALKRFAKGQNVEHLTDEIEARLFEEIDYTLEASNYDFFRENIDNLKVEIPNVLHELSTDKILTLGMIEGKDIEEFLRDSPTQKQRDGYAQLIFDTFFKTLYELKAIHADPNPGNFIFMDNDKLGIIDFGCVKRVDDEFLGTFNTLHLSLIDPMDIMDIVYQYRQLNMIEDDTDESMLEFYLDIIQPLDQIYIEVFTDDAYDFKKNSDFSKRGFETIMTVQKKKKHSVHMLNEEYLFLDRTLLGYYAIFEKLEATIDTRYAKELMHHYKDQNHDNH